MSKSKIVLNACVKTGEYNNKPTWERVGNVMENPDGSRYMLMKKTFNPAGVPTEQGRDSIVISFFEPKPKD